MVAPALLWRYIARDVVAYAMLALAALVLLGVLSTLLRKLELLLAAGIDLTGAASLAAITLPAFLPYAVPAALLFGVLLTFGRMVADGEIVAMRAAGVSVGALLPPVVGLGLLAASITGALFWELEPHSHYRASALVRELALSVRMIEPGVFSPVGSRTVFVAESGDVDCPLRGLLIREPDRGRGDRYVAARCGSLVDADPDLALDLRDGSIHFSASDGDRYSLIRFRSMRIQLDVAAYIVATRRAKDLSVPELIDMRGRFARGESPPLRGGGRAGVDAQLHRRAALSLACVLLPLLAVPLGLRPLREGRSAGALTAIGVMALYWCLFSAGERVAEEGWVSPWLGLWTANATAAGLLAALLWRAPRPDA